MYAPGACCGCAKGDANDAAEGTEPAGSGEPGRSGQGGGAYVTRPAYGGHAHSEGGENYPSTHAR